MNTIEAIMNRKSIRKYTDQPIDEEAIQTILKAGMSGPTCVNARDWQFIVVQKEEVLNQMADANGRPAEPLRKAKLGILICGNTDLAFKGAKDYWVIDGAIAGQNMILAAEDLGIGSVWLGTWPQMNRVEGLQKLFGLPENLIPHSIIAFGYPAEDPDKSSKPVFEENKVTYIR